LRLLDHTHLDTPSWWNSEWVIVF